jgi:tetratricopeptide (TPR) repeat protein
MAGDFRKFDAQGFPVPPRFEDLQFFDSEPVRRPNVSIKAKRWLVLVLVAAIVVPIVFGPKILSQGRKLFANWLANRAMQKYDEGNFAGAIADLNEAIEWSPKSRDLFAHRADCHEKLDELEDSLADWNKSIELHDSDGNRRRGRAQRTIEIANSYARRSWVYVRLGRKDEALADADRAVERFRHPMMLNARAYARAILGDKLAEGLADVEEALQRDGSNSSYLDTRGYLLHLLGRNEEALAEMNQALAVAESVKGSYLRGQSRRLNERAFERELRDIDESLAVMYHHRGLIYQKLGRDAEAEKDLRSAKDFGYDPAKGVM